MTTQTAARVARSPKSSPLDGLRVLFLPKNSRVPYFEAFLHAGKVRHDWTVHIVCPPISVESWRRAVGSDIGFTLVPDFNETATWEGEAASVSEIDEFIGECERASGIPAGRIVLAGERDIGRGYSQNLFFWFSNKGSRRALEDNTTPFAYVRRIFAFARDTLRATKPDLLVFGEWADPICFTFYLVARQMGIRCVVNRHSKMLSNRCFWSDDFLMYNALARNDVAERRARKAPVSATSQEHIASFRAAPTTSARVRERWDVLERKHWFRHHATLARAFAVEFRHYLRGTTGPAPKPAWQLVVEHYRQPVLRWWQARFFRQMTKDELQNVHFVYLSMHKDPELGLNFQAPFWYEQYNTAALVAASLPTRYKLLIREHRKNTGRRPTQYYRELSRLPNVVLIDPFDDQFKYITAADLIVTENGSDGWEGLLFGRRVITLADNFYDATQLETRVRDPEQIASVVVTMLKSEPVVDADYDRVLGWMLDAEWNTTVPFDACAEPETFNLLARLLPQSSASFSEVALAPT
jgi:hypothetical protein